MYKSFLLKITLGGYSFCGFFLPKGSMDTDLATFPRDSIHFYVFQIVFLNISLEESFAVVG